MLEDGEGVRRGVVVSAYGTSSLWVVKVLLFYGVEVVLFAVTSGKQALVACGRGDEREGGTRAD